MNKQNQNVFIDVPEVTLPSGLIVPAFRVAKYISSRGHGGIAQSVAELEPWVEINYDDARKACSDAGCNLITETRALAIACDIARQDINWTGGKVGEGDIYQGLHKGSVTEAQAGVYQPEYSNERRWHQLSNGERIYDFAGNCFTWVFDDVQGDENGLPGVIDAKSISLTSAPYPAEKKGMGWRPKGERNWSGVIIIRGGYWDGGNRSGVFSIGNVTMETAGTNIGFRCIKVSRLDLSSDICSHPGPYSF